MVTTSIQLPETVKSRIETLAKQTGSSPSKIIRSYIESGLEKDSIKITLVDRMKHLKGSIKGPADLSTRKAFEG
jgi:predicted DNA-binding protein